MWCIRSSAFRALLLSTAFSGTLADAGGKRIAFTFHDSTLRAALDSLIMRHNVPVLYMDSEVEGKHVSARCEECSEEEALEAILKSTALYWRWTGAQFVISKRKPVNSESKRTVSGIVVDSLSNEYVSGASVYLSNESGVSDESFGKRGCTTNRYGFFSLPDIPSGVYTLTVRTLGYRTARTCVSIADDEQPELQKIRCVPTVIEMQEVLVEAIRSLPAIATPGVVRIDPVTLAQLPALGGESDVLRGLQLLPGVKSISEISSGLYIRGTTSDQNLYLLDGATIYNPTHLGGFLSTFNPDALRDVSIAKGMFSPEYGGRIGGVVDMMMREGTQERISGSGGISLLDARLTVEGPIVEGTTFMVEGRRAYFDFFIPFLHINNGEYTQRYYFYDVAAKVNSRLSESDHLFGSVYIGRDVYSALGPSSQVLARVNRGVDIWWGNSTGNLRWTHVFSPNLFATCSAVYSSYKFVAEETSPEELNAPVRWASASGIRDIVLRAQLEYYAGSRSTITAGAEIVQQKIQSDVGTSVSAGINPVFGLPAVTTHQASVWGAENWQAGDDLSITLGARFSRFASSRGTFTRVEPRVSAALKVAEDFTLHAAVSQSSQFLQSFVDRGLVAYLPTNIMYPPTDRVQPSGSFHVSVGTDMKLCDGSYTLSSGLYWRTMQNIHEFKEDATFSAGSNLEGQILAGKGKSYGFELLLRRQEGSFSGWLGYSLSWTTNHFDQINGGEPFSPRWDRRHEIGAAFSYSLGEHWEFGATWTFGTGQPHTLPTGVYSYSEIGVQAEKSTPASSSSNLDYATRDGSRLPAFHKLDLVFIHKYHWFGLPFQLSLNLYNAYNRMNPFAWEVRDEPDPNSRWSIGITQHTLFPIIPSVGLSVKF
jgi:hypothetical protein